MDSGSLFDWADKAARPRPGVLVDDSFGADWHAYKVGDKVFMIVTEDPNEQIITLKADPQQAQALREHLATVTAGRYLDKGHWISIGAGRGITRQLVTNLVKTSYRSVVETMSTHDQPTGP